MASAGSVVVDFSAETARFTAELKKVQSSLSRMEGDFKRLDKVAGVALRFFSAGALIGFAKQAFNAADAIGDAASRAGIAVETFSRLQFAAGQTDVEMGALTTGMQRFQIALSKADDGNKEAIASLSRFGLQAEALRSLSIEDQLAAVAEAFNQISDPADRTRLAVDLFGKSAGPQLVPLLAQGKAGIQQLTAQADRLGITLSSTTAAGIDQADRAIKQLTGTLSAYTSKFVAGLSIAILGPPDEFIKLDNQIIALRSRIDQITQGVGGRDPVSVLGSANPLVQEFQAANAEIDKLLAKQRELLNPVPIAASPIAQISNAVQTIDLAPIQALKIEVDELSVAYANLAIAAANAPIERMREISTIVGGAFVAAQREVQQQITDGLFAQLDARTQAENAAAAYRVDLEQRASEAILQTKLVTTNAALGLLQALGTKNKAFAIAAIVFEKAIAIQRVLMHNKIAAELAFASQLVPGIPATLATATAAKAAVLAQGYLSAGLIAATGALQIADVTSGGGRSAIGSPLNPAVINPAGGLFDDEQPGATSQNAVQIVFTGNMFNSEQTRQYILDTIKEAVNDRDVVVISPSSRQAQDIREQQ